MNTAAARARRNVPASAHEILLAATVTGSVLAVGSVHLPALLVVAIAAFAALAIALRRGATIRPTLPVAAFASLAIYTLLQALPIPIRAVAAIAPANADVWSRALGPLGESVRWATISLDPGATLVEALKWAVYGATFATASFVAARRGAAWGMGLVFSSAIATALATLLHGLAGATQVYGLYTPSFSALPWHVGPLLNPNNLAGYLVLGATCGAGLLLHRGTRAPRWLIAVGVAALFSVEVGTGSRGGFLAQALALAGLAVLLVCRALRRGDPIGRELTGIGALLAAAAGGAAFAWLGATGGAMAELHEKGLAKLGMPLAVWPMIRDHWGFGVGRGAFESTFAAYNVERGTRLWTHAEDFPAQWLSEWGVVAGAAALAVFAVVLRPRKLGVGKSALATAGWVAVIALLLHNLYDLALELPGVMIAVVVVVASLHGEATHRREPATPATSKRSWAGAATALAAVAWIAAALGGRNDVATERARLREAYASLDARALPAFRSELRSAILRHPADPYFPLLGGVASLRFPLGNPLVWVSRSLDRGLVNPHAHLVASDALAPISKGQALLELRLAGEADPTLAPAIARRALAMTRDRDELLTAAPTGAAGVAVLDALASRLTAPDERDLQAALDREALARDPAAAGPHINEASNLLDALSPGSRSTRCASAAPCEAELEQHARAIDAALPDEARAAEIRARLLVLRGRPDDAAALLAERCTKVADRYACLLSRLAAASQGGTRPALDAAVRDLRIEGCREAMRCAEAQSLIGDTLMARGDFEGAMVAFTRACDEEPDALRLTKLADAASRAGAHDRAANALDHLLSRYGGGEEIRRRSTAERAASLTGHR